MTEKDYREEFSKLFENLNETKAEKIDTSTVKLIDHVHNRVSYTDQKHRSLLQINIALLSFSVAFAVFLNQYNKVWLNWAAPFIISLLFVTSFGVVLFNFQDRSKRPFIEVAKTWRWFYHYSIDPTLPVGPYYCNEQKERSKKGYLEGLYRYAKNTVIATPQKILRQDVEQLYILLTSERLKNEFLKQSHGVLVYGFLLSITSFGLNLLLTLLSVDIIGAIIISVGFFIIAFIITCCLKVFPTTKSRKNWSYIEEK